jgi:hypothetical protein
LDEEYVPDPQSVAATSRPGADATWYTDSGATHYITGELDQLMMHKPYTGTDQIHAANDLGMAITRIGTSIIPPPVVILSSKKSCMFHPHTRILYLFIALLLITTHLLNFILISSLLRTEKQRRCYCTDRVKAVSTHFHHLHPSFRNLCSMPSRFLLIDGIVV